MRLPFTDDGSRVHRINNIKSNLKISSVDLHVYMYAWYCNYRGWTWMQRSPKLKHTSYIYLISKHTGYLNPNTQATLNPNTQAAQTQTHRLPNSNTQANQTQTHRLPKLKHTGYQTPIHRLPNSNTQANQTHTHRLPTVNSNTHTGYPNSNTQTTKLKYTG